MPANSTDEFFVAASPAAVFGALLDPSTGWWPGADVRFSGDRLSVRARSAHRLASRVVFAARVDRVRPEQGLTWWLERGEVHGRGEWWLEPFKGGTIVHYYLEVEPGDGGRLRRWPSRVRRHRWAIRRGVNAMKDRLEGRGAGNRSVGGRPH